jgi:arylsulfatase A-like enzyme
VKERKLSIADVIRHRRVTLLLVPLLLWLLLWLKLWPVGCVEEQGRAPNLLLITIDTLRADHLGAWGYERPTSPGIDELARESVVFEDAHAHSAWTLPSLASLMTSLYSSTHACWGLKSSLGASFTTLAEILRGHGYSTAAVANHIFLAPKYGLHQGFQHYDQELVEEGIGFHQRVTSPRVTQKATAWLEGRRAGGDPWLLWVHYFDPHQAYKRHEGLSERFGVERPVDLYDGEIRFTDRAVHQLLRQLEGLGLARDTIVVVWADHGEEFEDHGGRYHGKTLHREITRVPLIIRVPGMKHRRVTDAVRSVDVLPTLLELMGLPAHPDAEGRSLVPAMQGLALEPLPVFAELRMKFSKHADSLILGRWKLIRGRPGLRPHLFDLESDPLEKTDLAAEHPDTCEQMVAETKAMKSAAAKKAARYGAVEEFDLSEDEIEALRRLGYWSDEK